MIELNARLKNIEQNGQERIAVLANIRGENYDINGLILLFDTNGKLLKKSIIGDADHIDRIIELTALEDSYLILINRIHKK